MGLMKYREEDNMDILNSCAFSYMPDPFPKSSMCSVHTQKKKVKVCTHTFLHLRDLNKDINVAYLSP